MKVNDNNMSIDIPGIQCLEVETETMKLRSKLTYTDTQ